MFYATAQVNVPVTKPSTNNSTVKIYLGSGRNGFYTAKCKLEKDYVMLECMDTSKNMVLFYCGPIDHTTDSSFTMYLDYACNISVTNLDSYMFNQYHIADPMEKKQLKTPSYGLASDSISFNFLKKIQLVRKNNDTATLSNWTYQKQSNHFFLSYADSSTFSHHDNEGIRLKIQLDQRLITTPPLKYQVGLYNHYFSIIDGRIQPETARFIVQFKQSKGKLIVTHPGLFAHLQTLELTE